MSIALASLWLPILASAAAVWVVSAIIWMVMPHHKKDHIGLPDEKGFVEFVRSRDIPPGNYGFPDFSSCADRNSPEMKAAWERGPIGVISLWPAPVKMGPKMFATFVVYLVVSTLLAYLASVTLDPHADFRRVMRVVGTAGVLAYCFAFLPSGIWFGAYLRTMVACVIDGIVYGLVTGAIFAWLWPR